LVWYNLTQGVDAQWRKRWFCHLLGYESSVLLWQSLFEKEDAVVRQSVLQNPKQTKRSMSFAIQTITNDLLALNQHQQKHNASPSFLSKLLFRLCIPIPL
jgi:hypothetical protein